ncbi:MAG: iron-sulfur cluster assembly scaffold protein [Candidatus Tectomicrobia bacterium]|uniref:Iron-sulfur cluster assembly scaffold protein n=1 Tax=Tectimicrobiota bacterium TaxID=2528274 RepID=A0A932I4Z8_UNCTE|nr:iron-sulfur cluster assembly scaffold protein [Candidatus Tectomicrobia bacterium]
MTAYKDEHHYNETVLAHIAEPHNVGTIENADAVGRGTNPACGDEVTLYLRFEGGKVAEAKMEILGCGAITASMSSLTDLARGKTPEELMALTAEEIALSVGGLPRHKRHCAQLAQRVLRDALRGRG